MLKYVLGIGFLFFGICMELLAQTPPSPTSITYSQFKQQQYNAQTFTQLERWVEQLTAEQANNKQYALLKKTCRIALKRKIDFYSLRMRMGTVHYQQQQYGAALAHFQKAYRLNPLDTNLQQYLYKSYLANHRYDDAADLVEGLSIPMRAKLGYTSPTNKKWIDALTLTIGICPSNNLAHHQYQNLRNGNPPIGRATYGTVTYYANMLIEQTLRRRWTLVHSLGAFRFDDLDVAQVADTSLQHRSSTYQYQYNAVATYQSPKAWKIAMGLGYYRVQAEYIYGNFDFQTPQHYLYPVHLGYNCYMANLMISKQLRAIQPTLSLSASNFGFTKQYQAELGVTYYPFGQSKLYATTALSYNNNNFQHQWVVSQQAGGNITRSIAYYLSASYGNHWNYVTYNGLLAYCTLDPITLMLGGSLHFYWKKLDISPAFYFQQRHGNIYQSNTVGLTDTKHFYYYTNFMMLNVKYKF